jgi:hypothetical protein
MYVYVCVSAMGLSFWGVFAQRTGIGTLKKPCRMMLTVVTSLALILCVLCVLVVLIERTWFTTRASVSKKPMLSNVAHGNGVLEVTAASV